MQDSICTMANNAKVPTNTAGDAPRSETVQQALREVRLALLVASFGKVTATSAIASGNLRHLSQHYHIEAVVKKRIPLTGEMIDKPMVNPAANKGDPMEGGYIVFLPLLSIASWAIDRAPGQLGPFA
ncbi:hypothetical protein LIER_07438 [Lithospermum erythrorhizon]|uniref:Uncharacterized protein n=1 Tax=Lithospermum erythrorhizon TaxID=34254 RepID=A0AAV3P823_LITER